MDFEECSVPDNYTRFACIRFYFKVYFQGATVGLSRMMLKLFHCCVQYHTCLTQGSETQLSKMNVNQGTVGSDPVILATAGYDHTVRFWQAHSGICTRTVQHQDSVSLL